MTHKEATAKLRRLCACQEARDWFASQPDPETAWAKCERGDWMLWLCGKFAGKPESEGRKSLVLAACQCARVAMKYVPKGEKRPLECIKTAERWANGEATIGELCEAKRAADAAAYAAYDAADAAAYAAYDAADAAAYDAAAYAADAAAYAAYAAAAYAADAAAYAAYAAARTAARAAARAAAVVAAWDADVRSKVLRRCAAIVRKFYPTCPGMKGA